MKIDEKYFNNLKTEADVNTIFTKSNFCNIYQVAEKNLETFGKSEFPTLSFQSNLDSIIANSKRKYDKKLVGSICVLISKVCNFIKIHQFKSKLALAEKLKNDILSKPQPVVQKPQSETLKPQQETSIPQSEPKKNAFNLSELSRSQLSELMKTDPGKMDEIFLQVVEEEKQSDLSMLLYRSREDDIDTFNRFIAILTKNPKHAELLFNYALDHHKHTSAGIKDDVELYIKAAEGGSVTAMKRLALLYFREGQIEKTGFVNPIESFRWIKKAAEAGDPEAMYYGEH